MVTISDLSFRETPNAPLRMIVWVPPTPYHAPVKQLKIVEDFLKTSRRVQYVNSCRTRRNPPTRGSIRATCWPQKMSGLAVAITKRPHLEKPHPLQLPKSPYGYGRLHPAKSAKRIFQNHRIFRSTPWSAWWWPASISSLAQRPGSVLSVLPPFSAFVFRFFPAFWFSSVPSSATFPRCSTTRRPEISFSGTCHHVQNMTFLGWKASPWCCSDVGNTCFACYVCIKLAPKTWNFSPNRTHDRQ